MRIAAILATVIAALPVAAGGGVDDILARFEERRKAARSAAEYQAAVREAVAALDAHAAGAKKDDPDLPRARYIAAEMTLGLDEPARALARLEELLKLHESPADLVSGARFLAGEIAAQLGEGEKSRAWFAEFVQRAEPGDDRGPRARTLSALTYAAEQRYDEALKAIDEIRKEQEQAGLHRAIVLHLAGRNEEAQRTLEGIVKEGTNLMLIEVAKRLLTDWLQLGRPVPELEGSDRAGAPFRRTQGRVTLIYFFAAEYEESMMEAALLRRLHDAYGAAGLEFRAVSIDRKPALVDAFIKDQALPWPVCIDGNGYDGPLAKRFQVRALPFVMLVDRKGVLRYFNPACTPHGREVRPAIERLLGEK